MSSKDTQEHKARRGPLTMHLSPGVSPDAVLDALDIYGEYIKVSRKSTTRRVAAWVVKESRFQYGLGIIKHTSQRGRYRRAWRAILHLNGYGVGVPRPIAFIEKRLLGVIAGNVLIAEFLEDCPSVEQHLKAALAQGAGREAIASFLEGLADAVNKLNASGAYHSDLSGKNILTRGGTEFFFIDLDGVVLGCPYTEALRRRNHIQLYDSFCDDLDDDLLAPFIHRMLPPGVPAAPWFESVKQGQAQRRAQYLARKKKKE